MPSAHTRLGAASRALAARLAGRFAAGRGLRLSAGNRLTLLQGGPEFFRALLEAIAGASSAVHLETYIFAADDVGRAVLGALRAAAQRGVRVQLLVDGFGSAEALPWLRAALAGSGVHLRVFRPVAGWLPRRRHLRRLHRKLALIDEQLAFVGGININEDPPRDEFTGDAIGPRLDFAVRCEGPVVGAVARSQRRLWWAVGLAAWDELPELPLRWRLPAASPAGGMQAALVLRDNLRHRHSIERAYLAAIRAARREVLIANAYFLPGRRLRRALARACARGVRVRLLLQGRVEYRLQHAAQRSLYGSLLRAGIEIHEYRSSYLHAKVAVADELWCTIGSSNIDPLSLLLAREANLVVHDAGFSGGLRAALEASIDGAAHRLHAGDLARRSWRGRLVDALAYSVVRLLTAALARADY